MRYALVAALAVALGAVHLRNRPATLCPFRDLTGVPCPLCGGTTAVSDLGHGELRSALAASPLALGLLAVAPLSGVVRPPVWWSNRVLRWFLAAGVLATAEIWQLVRFGIISF